MLPTIKIDFTYPHDIVGYTLTFDTLTDTYPVKFIIKEYGGSTLLKSTAFDNASSVFETRTNGKGITHIEIEFYKMNKPHSRLHVQNIQFGIGKVFTNDTLLDVSHKHYVNPVSAELPLGELQFTVENNNGDYDIDNPNSIVNFLSTQQEIVAQYGHTIGDTIEWVNLGKFYLNEWSTATNGDATFKCSDIYGVIEEKDAMSQFQLFGIAKPTYGDLARSALMKAGLMSDQYVIDPYLDLCETMIDLEKEFTTLECLQYIANATRCILTKTDDGKLWIKPNFDPKFTFTATHEDITSNTNALTMDSDPVRYLTFETSGFPLNGERYLIESGLDVLSEGYVSDFFGADSQYVEIHFDGPGELYNLSLDLENISHLYVTSTDWNGDAISKTYSPIYATTFKIPDTFTNVRTLRIAIVGARGGCRSRIFRIHGLENSSDFYITHNDTFDKPKATLLPELKAVITHYKTWNEVGQEYVSWDVRQDFNTNGQLVDVDTFLIDNNIQAEGVADWVGRYLLKRREFEIDYRGNPEIKAGDVIFLRSQYLGDMKSVVLSNDITFNGGAMKGKMKVRSENGEL